MSIEFIIFPQDEGVGARTLPAAAAPAWRVAEPGRHLDGPSHLTRVTCTHNNVAVNVTLSIDDEVIQEARRRAEAMGTSVNQLVREYLERFAGGTDASANAAEFERLSRAVQGNSRGWKFNREELHERR